MADDRVEEIVTLLEQVGQAHGKYETTDLHGVYDQDWARWYAGHLVEQGISALLGHAVTVDQIAKFFTDSFADYKSTNTGGSWEDYTARRMQAEL